MSLLAFFHRRLPPWGSLIPQRLLPPSEIWFLNNRKVCITKEICTTTDFAPTPWKNSWKRARLYLPNNQIWKLRNEKRMHFPRSLSQRFEREYRTSAKPELRNLEKSKCKISKFYKNSTVSYLDLLVSHHYCCFHRQKHLKISPVVEHKIVSSWRKKCIKEWWSHIYHFRGTFAFALSGLRVCAKPTTITIYYLLCVRL